MALRDEQEVTILDVHGHTVTDSKERVSTGVSPYFIGVSYALASYIWTGESQTELFLRNKSDRFRQPRQGPQADQLDGVDPYCRRKKACHWPSLSTKYPTAG